MDARYITTLALRLFAIWFCVSAFQLFGTIESLRQLGGNFNQSSLVSLSIIGVAVSIGIILWILSRPIAGLLTFDLAKQHSATRLSMADLVVVGCVLMGLWWLKNAVLPFVEFWLTAVARASYADESALATLDGKDKITIALDLLRIAIALFFICRPRHIAHWILGRPATPDEAPGEAS
ncbi:hypothetical protein [Dyella sp. GSA-30]|uniref:hypothetical protein n=1 Tax=Dyella sp. GSA-30 TaxID=2994496 RepID=UPI0024926628|nr:hypothetical protein [Dyella sp. GSA-30]BDU19451.1 hypothetical protein DYGSA30_09080 [Dyella sp. GSA-30]